MKLTSQKLPLVQRVKNYYPTFKKLADEGKKPSFFRRMFSGETLAGCQIHAECEKALAAQKSELAAKSAILEKALALNSEHNLVMNNVHDIIDIVSIPDGAIVMASKSYMTQLGYAQEDLIGMNTLSTVHPDDLHLAQAMFQKGLETGEGIAELRVRKKDGSYIWMEVKGNLVMGQDGKPVCGILISRNIDEFKKVSDKLRESEEKFRGMFESMSEVVAFHQIIYGEDGKPADYRYTVGNAALAKAVGIPIEGIVGKTAKEIFGGEAPYLEIYAKVSDAGEPVCFETYFTRLQKHFLISAFSLAAGQFVTIANDITGRKEMEEKLKSAVASEQEANAMKNRFLGIVAHDLRSPFNSISGFSGIALEEAKKPETDKDELIKYLEYVDNSARSTFFYVENLLILSRIYTRATAPEQERFNISSIVSNEREINKLDAMKKGITIQIEDGELPVFADKAMVTTVLHNLIRNSIKFTSNGKITVSTAQEGTFVRVTVSDTGIGMPPNILDNLFKLDGKTTRKGTDNEPGTGLGAILVKELVELNGGTVSVESTEGKGTKFSFTLPAAQD